MAYPQMNPMAVPYYGTTYPSYYNPYPYYQNPPQMQQPVQQPQSQPQQQAQAKIIQCRAVNSDSEIVPNEIPMDGSVCLFPKNDWSCIYAKTWSSDGTIKTFLFECQKPDNQSEEPKVNKEYTAILERLDRIEKSIKKNKFYPSQSRKEEPPNE